MKRIGRPRGLRFILIVGVICDPVWSWKHRDVIRREWV